MFAVFCNMIFILDVVRELIGRGGSADVYKCLLFEKKVHIALKVFHISTGTSSIFREKTVGFDKKLESEYTLNYRDRFVIRISEDVSLDCVVMDLFSSSLEKFLLSKLNSKQIMTEDVFSFKFILFFFCRIYLNNNKNYSRVVCSSF
jgi:hypothetical protein